ncbi:MAG TPA: dihydropteroate synthase, partial [Candidatus Omnitrophota bacterium]|nr:dihydropteroate synthase [Candidatus Omnitrophota bacterium]
LKKAYQLIKNGADILDVGGESTRPGAKKISLIEETHRVIPIIRILAKKIKIPISIDTYKTEVAQQALDAGASIVNTIMGTHPKKDFLKMVRGYQAAIVLMHIKGTPQTMQKNISYHNCVKEIIVSLRKSIEKCLEIGIKEDKIIIDPGIGFGKTVFHNLEILNRLDLFHVLRRPILIGPSRKSFIGKILNKEVSQRLMGTTASICASILKGAHIIRVHDVKQIKEAAILTDAIINEGKNLSIL